MNGNMILRTEHFSENRSWLIGQHGADMTPGITLDLTRFTAATHYPKGYIPSGIVLGIITNTGLAGPYDPAATDGTEQAHGLLFGSLTVPEEGNVAGSLLVHGFVQASRLPIKQGPGHLTSTARTQLTLIRFEG